MTEHRRKLPGALRGVCAIGVGEGVDRDFGSNARQKRAHAGHLLDEDGIPPVEEPRVVEADAERIAQACEVGRRFDLAALMPLIGLVVREFLAQQRRVAARMRGPAREHALEIDADHDIAEIEQQRVDGGGSHRIPCHARARPDGLELVADLTPALPQIVVSLQAEEESFRHAEVTREPQVRVGSDRALSQDDLVDTAGGRRSRWRARSATAP